MPSSNIRNILLYIFLGLSIIFMFSTAILGISYILSAQENVKLRQEECSTNITETTDNEEMRVCDEEEAMRRISENDVAESLDIIDEDNAKHVVITLQEDNNGIEVLETACIYDLTDDIKAKIDVGDDSDLVYLSEILYSDDGKLIYNYAGTIYIQDLVSDTLSIVVSGDIVSGNKHEDEQRTITIQGPYPTMGERNGVLSYIGEDFIYYIDFVWGCELDTSDEYCDSMLAATKELCSKGELGMLKYDMESGRSSMIDASFCASL